MDANGGEGRPDRPMLLRELLAEADVPCPGCGYNLRGLRAEVCPECNQALVLQVALAEPRLGPLIAALVGLAVGAGTAGTWLLLFFVSIVFQGSPGLTVLVPFLVIMSAGVFGEGVPLALLARRSGRAWFRRLSPLQGRYVVAAAWGATGIWTLVLLFFVLRQ